MSIRIQLFTLSVFVLAGSPFGHACAQTPTLSINVTTGNPNTQIIYGCGTTYSLSNPPAPWTVSGPVTWSYQQTDCVGSVTSAWTTAPDQGNSMIVTEDYPGTFNIKAIVPLSQPQNQANPNPPKTTVTANLTVKVPPPDGIILPNTNPPIPAAWGFNPPNQQFPAGVMFTQVVQLGFPVTCQGQNVLSLSAVTMIKEDLTNRLLLGKAADKVIDQAAVLAGITGTSIIDPKQVIINNPNDLSRFLQNSPNPFPPGFVFSAYKQTLKLVIPDLNGNPRTFPLGPSFTFSQTSSNGRNSPTGITVK